MIFCKPFITEIEQTMGAEQSQTNTVDYEEKLFNKLGCFVQNKAIMPSSAAVLMYQLKNLKPDQVDLSRADQATRDEFARIHYNVNSENWFYDGDCNFTSEFLDQVSCLVDETGCNKWVAFYGFVLNEYDVERTKQYCSDNFVDNKQSVYGIPLRSEDEGWRVMYEKVLELPSVKMYRPPEGYRVQHRQPNGMNQQMLMQMLGGHGHDHEDDDQDDPLELDEHIQP